MKQTISVSCYEPFGETHDGFCHDSKPSGIISVEWSTLCIISGKMNLTA